MLNLKKGLAVVLAAATAVTFAPVANLGQAVVANATATNLTANDSTHVIINQSSVDTITPTVGQTATYQLKMANFVDGEKASLSWEGDDAIAVLTTTDDGKVGAPEDEGSTVISSSTDQKYELGTVFEIYAKAKGNVTFTVGWGDSNAKKITWKIQVSNPNEDPGLSTDLTANTEPLVRQEGNTYYVHPSDYKVDKSETTLTATESGYGIDWDLTGTKSVESSNDAVVAIVGEATKATHSDSSTGASAKVKFIKTGTATVTFHLKATAKNASKKSTYGTYTDGNTKDVSVTFVVLAPDSKFQAGGTNIAKVDYTTAAPQIVETLYLTEKNPSKSLNVTFSDGQKAGEKIAYKGVALNGDTTTNHKATAAKKGTSAWNATHTPAESNYANTDLTIDDKGQGTVTATANALNATEQYYDILVTNNLTGADAKAGVIRVITIRNEKDFTSVSVKTQKRNSEITKTATAAYDTDGSAKDGSASESLVLSTKDLKEIPFVASKNTSKDLDITSSDTSKVTYDKATQTLKAGNVGTAVVTVKASSDTKYYGNATITFNVEVTDQYVVNAIKVENATPIVLTKDKKEETIKASCPGGNTLSYRLVTPNADGSYTATTDSHVKVDPSTGKVTYTGVGAGEAIVEITGTANTDALAPAAAHVTVQYTDKKAASQLKVDKNALNLDAGETKSVAASGTAITVSSSDPEVATATYADGQVSVTGVKKGVAVITVTDAGNASYDSASAQIVVYVDGATVTPEKVTGLKVSNKKGAKVSVTWTSQGKNINYRVYKKVGNGKWVAKNVAGSKTTLSVKKGAKVQVKVKSYVKDENGKTTWGPAATKAKTFKTDKK